MSCCFLDRKAYWDHQRSLAVWLSRYRLLAGSGGSLAGGAAAASSLTGTRGLGGGYERAFTALRLTGIVAPHCEARGSSNLALRGSAAPQRGITAAWKASWVPPAAGDRADNTGSIPGGSIPADRSGSDQPAPWAQRARGWGRRRRASYCVGSMLLSRAAAKGPDPDPGRRKSGQAARGAIGGVGGGRRSPRGTTRSGGLEDFTLWQHYAVTPASCIRLCLLLSGVG